MANSLNIPSSPSLPCIHILQTHSWPTHLLLHLASTWWGVRAVPEAVCGLSLLEQPVHLSVYDPKQWPQGKGGSHGLCGSHVRWTLNSCTAPEVLPGQSSAPAWCPSCTRLPNLCCHMAPAQGHHPTSSSKNPWWNRTSGGFSFYFFKDSSLKPPKPLDRAQFCSQNYLKISSNLEWESTKTCTYFVFKTAATFLFQIWNFIHFFSSLITQAGQGFHME